MRRGAKPAKTQGHAKSPPTRKSAKKDGSTVRDLWTRLGESLQREEVTVEILQEERRALTAALEQQRATREILRVISSSPTDARPVFETIVASAGRLYGADTGIASRQRIRKRSLRSSGGWAPRTRRRTAPASPSRGSSSSSMAHGSG